MSDDELTLWETRIGTGCSVLGRACTAWYTAGEYAGKERTKVILGRAVGGVATTWFLGGIVYVTGPVAWGITGAVLALGVWVAGRPAADEEEEWPALADEPGTLTDGEFVQLLHQLSAGQNLHLSTVRAALERICPGGDWSGPTVTALCEEVGARVRKGVSVPGATPRVTTGIHRDDLPPLPSPTGPAPVAVLTSNNNDNNNTNMHPDGVVIVPDMMQGARR